MLSSTLSARKRAADFRKKMDSQAAGVTTEAGDNAFAKFDRLKSKVEQAEAEAEAMAELRAGEVGAEPADLEDIPDDSDLDVSAELAELKKTLQ